MQLVFLLVSLVGGLYFLLKHRRFDFFSIAFFAAELYFLPGFAGFAMHPWVGDLSIPVPLVDEVYIIFCVVLASILLGAICFDRLIQGVDLLGTPELFSGGKYAGLIAVATGILGMAVMMYSSSSLLFSPDKSEVLKGINRWYIVWVMGSAVAVVLAYSRKMYLTMMVAIGLLALDFFLGFRTASAITVGSLLAMKLSTRGSSRLLIHNWAMLLSGTVLVAFLFFYKPLFPQVKTGDWGVIADQVTAPGFYSNAVIYSEPFTTQAILNEIIIQQFTVDPAHFSNALLQLMVFSPDLGIRVPSFNDLFQSSLFPGYDWGLANNIWAEMWSSGGWELLAVFVLINVAVLGVGSLLLRVRNPEVRSLVCLVMICWATFIHRNDLGFQINLEKQIVMVWLLAVVGGMIFWEILWRRYELRK